MHTNKNLGLDVMILSPHLLVAWYRTGKAVARYLHYLCVPVGSLLW